MYTVWFINDVNEQLIHSDGYDALETAFVIADRLNDRMDNFYYVADKDGTRWTRENGNGKLIIW